MKKDSIEVIPQVILTGSIFIYAPFDSTRYEIFMEDDQFKVKKNGKLQPYMKFSKIESAIRYATQNIHETI